LLLAELLGVVTWLGCVVVVGGRRTLREVVVVDGGGNAVEVGHHS